MKTVSSHEIGRELIDALGLQGRSIISITLRVRVGLPAQLRVTENVRRAGATEFVGVVKRYELIAKDGSK